MKRTLLCLCLFGLMLTLLQAQISEATGVVVKTEYGRVKGFVDEDTKTFTWLDIPYAKPPVGDLRWKPPQEPDPWSGILKTEEFGNACAQVGGLYGPNGSPTSLTPRQHGCAFNSPRSTHTDSNGTQSPNRGRPFTEPWTCWICRSYLATFSGNCSHECLVTIMRPVE